jgi:hypothetical protein
MNAVTASTLHRPQDALLSDMALPLRQTFFPLGFGIQILTNRQEVLDAAEVSFGHRTQTHCDTGLTIRIGISTSFSAQPLPAPTRRQYNHLYSMVADAENQSMLDLLTGTNFTWLNESAVIDPLYMRLNFLEKVVYLLLGARTVTDIHAGCVSRNGKGILLCGDSGAGKSTLSYACARAGWTYTSDDTCYLINESDTPRVTGHSHRVRFRPAAKKLFPELHNRAITERMEGKPSIELPIAELPVEQTAREVDIAAIVFLHRSTTQPFLVPCPTGTVTRRMCEDLYSAGEIRAFHQTMLEKLAAVPTFELHYDRLEDGIATLDQLVQSV